MADTPFLRVPIGKDAGRYATLQSPRTACVVSHTIVAAQRLFDVIGVIESNPDVQEVHTVAPDDAFGGGTERFLEDSGCLVVPWTQAKLTRFDVNLTAAYGSLEDLWGPVIVLPHGIGYNKYAPGVRGRPTAQHRSVYGLDPQRITRNGQVVPTRIVLSHPEQLELLAEVGPEAVEVAVVAGDPTVDLMVSSRSRRGSYRDALAVAADEELVVISSTWGPNSLFGQHCSSLDEMVGDLVASGRKVAFLLHPNVWIAHGRRKVLALLRPAMARGMIVLPPENDWRSTMVAADLVVGDHGSATLYGAHLRIPVVVTTAGRPDVVASGPVADLLDAAPHLDRAQSLAHQLRAARRGFEPGRYDWITGRISGAPGKFHEIMAATVDDVLGTSRPNRPRATAPLPAPRPFIDDR